MKKIQTDFQFKSSRNSLLKKTSILYIFCVLTGERCLIAIYIGNKFNQLN